MYDLSKLKATGVKMPSVGLKEGIERSYNDQIYRSIGGKKEDRP